MHYPASPTEIHQCQYLRWKHHFQDFLLHSKEIELSCEAVDALQQYQGKSASNDSQSAPLEVGPAVSVGEDGIDRPSASVCAVNKLQQDVATEIQRAIKQLGGSVFLKVNDRAPTDTFLPKDGSIKCSSVLDVIHVMSTSERVQETIADKARVHFNAQHMNSSPHTSGGSAFASETTGVKSGIGSGVTAIVSEPSQPLLQHTPSSPGEVVAGIARTFTDTTVSTVNSAHAYSSSGSGSGGIGSTSAEPSVLVLKQWMAINAVMEFRVFIRNRRIKGVSQRHRRPLTYAERDGHAATNVQISKSAGGRGGTISLTFEQRDIAQKMIEQFFQHLILTNEDFPLNNFIMDVYVDHPAIHPLFDQAAVPIAQLPAPRVWIIDVAAMGEPANPLLFHWAELLSPDSYSPTRTPEAQKARELQLRNRTVARFSANGELVMLPLDEGEEASGKPAPAAAGSGKGPPSPFYEVRTYATAVKKEDAIAQALRVVGSNSTTNSSKSTSADDVRKFSAMTVTIDEDGSGRSINYHNNNNNREPLSPMNGPATLLEEYKLGALLGKGGFAKVREGVHRSTGEKVAVKIVSREGIKRSSELSIRKEVLLLSTLDHPNIVRTFAFYEEPDNFYVVMECISGGALFDRIRKYKKYTELGARDIAYVLLQAIEHYQDQNIVHRDLKPENLILTSDDDHADVKIVDFGFAAEDDGRCLLTDRCGTPMYVAPEILRKIPHGKPVDMWSFGVILFILLSGEAPFKDPVAKNVYQKIKACKYHFTSRSWKHISVHAADLVKKLLVLEPMQRLNVQEALSHPWFQVPSDELPKENLLSTIDGIRSFQAMQRFKAGVFAVAALNRMKLTLTRSEYIREMSKMEATVEARYTVDEEVGRGGYAVVYAGKSKLDQRKVAIKSVSRAKLKPSTEAGIRREVEILSTLHHKNVVKSYDFIETETHFNVVMECIEGGELFDRIIKKKVYTEKEARDLVVVLLKALKHCHDHNVAHRDLKPENLLMTSEDDDANLKLVDFGFAARCDGFSLTNQCGTPAYVAPEIIRKQPHGTPVDMWSFGVILYILLSGYPPFRDKVEKQLFHKIRAGCYEFHAKYWNKVSEEAKDLIRRLLNIDPARRLTVDDALAHPWVQADAKRLSSYDLSGSLSELELYQGARKFRAGVNAVLAIHKMSRLLDDVSLSDASLSGLASPKSPMIPGNTTPTGTGTSASEPSAPLGSFSPSPSGRKKAIITPSPGGNGLTSAPSPGGKYRPAGIPISGGTPPPAPARSPGKFSPNSQRQNQLESQSGGNVSASSGASVAANDGHAVAPAAGVTTSAAASSSSGAGTKKASTSVFGSLSLGMLKQSKLKQQQQQQQQQSSLSIATGVDDSPKHQQQPPLSSPSPTLTSYHNNNNNVDNSQQQSVHQSVVSNPQNRQQGQQQQEQQQQQQQQQQQHLEEHNRTTLAEEAAAYAKLQLETQNKAIRAMQEVKHAAAVAALNYSSGSQDSTSVNSRNVIFPEQSKSLSNSEILIQESSKPRPIAMTHAKSTKTPRSSPMLPPSPQKRSQTTPLLPSQLQHLHSTRSSGTGGRGGGGKNSHFHPSSPARLGGIAAAGSDSQLEGEGGEEVVVSSTAAVHTAESDIRGNYHNNNGYGGNTVHEVGGTGSGNYAYYNNPYNNNNNNSGESSPATTLTMSSISSVNSNNHNFDHAAAAAAAAAATLTAQVRGGGGGGGGGVGGNSIPIMSSSSSPRSPRRQASAGVTATASASLLKQQQQHQQQEAAMLIQIQQQQQQQAEHQRKQQQLVELMTSLHQDMSKSNPNSQDSGFEV